MLEARIGPTEGEHMPDWVNYLLIGFVVLAFLYIAWTTWFDKSIESRGTTRNRGISGERGDDYRDRNSL